MALSHLNPMPHSYQEGIHDNKPDTTEQIHAKPEYIHPAHNRPTHNRLDLVKAVGYTFGPSGKHIRDPTFQGRRQIQLIERKYSSDGNTQEIIDHIHTIYEPLKQALQTHGTLKTDIKIIPIVISRNGTFNVKTLVEIAQLVSFKEVPPDNLTYKKTP
jgi:hypothetical protein